MILFDFTSLFCCFCGGKMSPFAIATGKIYVNVWISCFFVGSQSKERGSVFRKIQHSIVVIVSGEL